MQSLRALTMILGGRAEIAELTHDGLTRLEVVWVRGLTSLGSLSRFPALQHLRVEDQLQLRSIDLSTASRALRHLSVFNCKNLSSLGGIADLKALVELRIGRTSLDFEDILRSGLPNSIKCVALYGKSKKANEVMRSRLDALGYTEFPHSIEN